MKNKKKANSSVPFKPIDQDPEFNNDLEPPIELDNKDVQDWIVDEENTSIENTVENTTGAANDLDND